MIFLGFNGLVWLKFLDGMRLMEETRGVRCINILMEKCV